MDKTNTNKTKVNVVTLKNSRNQWACEALPDMSDESAQRHRGRYIAAGVIRPCAETLEPFTRPFMLKEHVVAYRQRLIKEGIIVENSRFNTQALPNKPTLPIPRGSIAIIGDSLFKG